jgi:hypothetical protein
MLERDLQHPDITHALLTGYPRGGEPKPHFCEFCEREIDDSETVYEDEHYDYLCERCLLYLHVKE